MEGLLPWLVFVHVLGAFGFAIVHGVSAAVALRLRRESQLERVQTLLDLSQSAAGAMYAALLVLLLAGIAAAFVSGLWGRGWIWAAILILIAMIVSMYTRATPYYGALRRTSGLKYFDGRRGREPEAPDLAALRALLASRRPIELTAVGYLGLAAILWLMVLKPF